MWRYLLFCKPELHLITSSFPLTLIGQIFNLLPRNLSEWVHTKWITKQINISEHVWLLQEVGYELLTSELCSLVLWYLCYWFIHCTYFGPTYTESHCTFHLGWQIALDMRDVLQARRIHIDLENSGGDRRDSKALRNINKAATCVFPVASCELIPSVV